MNWVSENTQHTSHVIMSKSTDTKKSAAILNAALSEHRAHELVADGIGRRDVVEVDADASIIDAAETLWSKNVMGAPLYDRAQKKYIGFFDSRDVLKCLVADLGEGEAAHTSFRSSFSEALKKLRGNETSTGMTLRSLAARRPFASCKDDNKLISVCDMISPDSCDRVAVVDKDGKISNVISQSAIVSFLSAKVSRELLDEPLEDSGISYKKEVHSVLDKVNAAAAFVAMDAKGLNGMAVVDEEGALVANMSGRDIKVAVLDGGQTVDTDVLSYLAKVRQQGHCTKTRHPKCSVLATETVGAIINKLATTGYHRIFVTANNKPTGVVSVSDIVNFAVGY